MNRAFTLVLLGAFILAPAVSGAATQLGIRGGYSHASGSVFPGSDGIGGNGLYGVAASVGFLPMIDLEFAYERYTKDFSYSETSAIPIGGNAKYEDQAYLLTGKLHLPFGAVPLGVYGGGGASLHKIDISTDSDNASVRAIVERSSNEAEWHLVLGADLKLPVLPLLAYGEYRFQNVTGKNNPRYNSIYAGLNLYLQ